MADKKSWRDYSKNSSTEEETSTEKTGTWRDYTSDKSTSGKTSSGWRNYTDYDPTAIVGNSITNQVNSWLKNHNDFISNYQKRNAGRKYTYEDSYVSDSADWMNKARQQKTTYDAEADAILSYLDQHKDYLDSNWVNEIKSTLTKARGTQGQILYSSNKDNEYWAKFTPNEEQTAAGYTAEKLYNEWQTGQKQYAEDQTYDVEAGLLELEGLKKERDAYLAEQEEKRKQAQEDESFWDSLGRWLGTTPDTTIPLAGANDPISSERHTNEYDKRIAELEERIERSKYVQGYEGYMDNIEAADYVTNNQYVSTRTDVSMDDARYGLGEMFSFMGGEGDKYDKSKLFGDFMYDYINRNPDALAAAQVNDAADSSYFLGFDKGFLQTMSDDEIGVYNYLYKTQGKESANEYLSFIESDLKGRKKAQEQAFWAAYAKESPVGSSVFSTLMAPLKGVSYLGQAADMLDDGKMEENAGYNRFSYIPSTIRSQVSTTIENSGKWGKAGSFAYNTGMSMADFLFTTAVSGGNQAISLAIMGTGAAADATLAAKDRGLDDGEAFALGTIAGLAEVAMEKISLGAWLDGDMTEGALRYVLKNALSEGGEEAGTSMINLLADVMIAGDKSEWNMAMQAYIDQGKSPQEAFGLVAAEQAAQIGLDALGGILSGAAIGGGTYAGASAVAGINYGKDAKNKEFAQKIVAEGLELNPESQYVQKAQSKLEKGKNLTGMQVRNILAANQEQVTANDMQKIQQAAEKRLTDLGQTKDVSKVAEIATKWVTGQEITRAEKTLLTHSEYGSRVANELLPKNIASGDFSTEWAEEIGTKQVNVEAYNKKAIRTLLDEMAKAEDPNAYKSLESRLEVETPTKVSNTGKAVIRGTDEEIDLTNPTFKQITEDGVMLEANGKMVSSNEIDYDSEDQGLAINAIGKIEHITPEVASALYAKLDMTKPVMKQLNGMDEAFTYGYYNYSEADLEAGDFTGDLTKDQLKDAYNLGRYVRKNSRDANAETTKRMRTATEAEAAKQAEATEERIKSNAKELNVWFEDGDKVVKFDEAGHKYDDKRMAGVKTAQFLQRLGIGGKNIYFYESHQESDGKFYRTNANGEIVEAENGWIDANGDIHIDINAGADGRGVTLYTLGHELTHFIEVNSKEKYQALVDMVTEAYAKTDMTMHSRVLAKQKFLEGKRGKTVSYSEAHSEVVADALSTMLSDGNLAERLAEIRAKDKGLHRLIKRFINKVIAKFRKAYAELSPDQQDAQDVRQMKEVFDNLQAAFAEALVDASDSFRAGESFRSAEKNATQEGSMAMSIREVVGESGKKYGKGVYLDSNKLTNVPEDQRKATVIGLFRKLGGKKVIAYDQNGAAIEISIAEGSRRYKNKKGKSVPVNNHITSFLNNPVKQEALILADELIAVSRFEGQEKAVHAHDWLDNDGKNPWDVWKVFIQEKNNSVWEATLKIANTVDGEKVLYEIYPIEMVEAARKPGTSTTNDRVAQPDTIVKSDSVEAMDVEVDAKTESVAPAVLKSERTWTSSDYVQEREKAAKEIAKAIGVSEQKAKDYIDSINSIAKMIAEDRSRLDYFSSPGRTSFVGNVEYGGSFDFSTLCKKRRLLTGTFTAIQKALPNTALTADEILDIRNRMKEANLEVSCGLCYVEGSRANMGQFAKEFLRLYKQYYPDAWQPNMADVNTPDGIEWVRINHPECYEQYEYFWNHYGTLKEGDKNLFASQQKPKLYQLHTEYKSEILDKFNDDDNVEEKNLNGGIRLQSFSDFEIVHLIDTMQIIMDMSRVGLAGQAYTKVPDFAWALGDTGLKINLSLIAKGVDADGKLIFDDVEGMPIAEAMKLRDRYSKNVGTILVAFHDEQLLAAMADGRVDFIIPFHRSQWKKSQYEAMGLPVKTKDYTFMQNEKYIKPQFHEYRGRMVKDKATNYMPNEYWDFSKSGKENAEAYLEMCARNNKRPKFYKLLQNNGDGSYSLKADGSTDGYWKLLIDFKMYDNEGNGSPQMPVKPEFNMEEANRMLNDYKGGHSNFPVAQGIVDGFVKDYKASHKGQQVKDAEVAKQMPKVIDRITNEIVKPSDKKGYNQGVDAGEVKYSAREAFYTEYDAWDKKDTNRTFVVGTTSDALQSVGMKDQNIVLRSGTVLQKINDHPEMTFDIFKGIPELLEHPVIVQFSDAIDSKTKRPKYDSSITVLGELYADVKEDGKTVKKPVLVSIELLPTNQKKTTVLDFAIIKSAYSKNALQQYLNENSILYIDPDKKRTDSWLSLNRLQLPLGENRYGPIRKIAYVEGKVKVQNSKNMTAIEKALFDAGVIDEFGQKRNSERGDGTSNRDLLANAFEGIAKSSPEYKLIQEYKGRIRIINEYEEDLAKINAEIRKLTFGTEGQRDTQRLKQLQAEAKKLAESINRNDKKLLSLEASEPLRKVIERERKKEAQKTKEHVKEIQQNKKVRAEQTELRHKIRKVIRDLDKILNRGNKQRNVKEDIQPVVTKALQAAEILFIDNYGSYDMLRNGIGADMSDTEEALVKSCAKMLKDIDSMPNDGYDGWQARQEAENRLKTKMSKLKDVFARERKRLNNTTVSTILGELADAYKSMENSKQSYVQGAYSEPVYNFLKNLQSEVGGTIVKDMTKSQLESVYAAYKMVLTTVRKANQMFNEELKLTREQLGNAVIQEVLEAGGVHLLGTKLGDAFSQADWNNMKPIWLANRIGSDTFSKLVNGLFKGQYNFAVDISEAKKFKLEMDEKYHPRSWDTEKLYEFESSTGKKFSLNLQQIMSLYAFSKRDQAYSHLLNGGFVFENNSTVVVEKNGIKRTYIHKGATSYKLNESVLGDIISSLSKEQKAYVDEMQKYLSAVMGAKGNEVSMQLYGIKMFNEQFYFPLRSSGDYMERAKEAEMKKQQGQINLVNSGFTHAVKPEATNPIVLSGFMDVWAEHCNEMSMYHSMVLPMEDFRKVYNYSTQHEEGEDSHGVYAAIKNAYGQAATNYIDQLYRELNAGATIDPRETPYKTLISRFKKSAVMLSASVVVQQFSSIGRAYAMIDPKYFTGSKVNSGTQLSVVEEMKKYAPVAIIKEMGGFDTGTKGSAKSYIVAEQYGNGERIQALVKDEQYRGDIMGYLPAKADEKTWCAIWEAVKRETKANHPDMDVKSDEFLKLAGERFSEVIEKTQVYDSVLARSANMRSKSGLMQMATAFMAEPTTTVNLIEDAIRRGDKKYLARTFGAVAVTILLNNALASIVYAMRDDDEDETFIEKYFQSFTSGMIDDINPMSYYPFLKDVYSLFQGYDVERTDMAVFGDVRDALKRVVTLLGKDTSSMDDDKLSAHYKLVNEAIMNILDAVSSAFGVPVKNVRRDAMGIINAWNTVGKDITERDTTWNSFWDKVGAAAKDTIPIYAWTKDKAKTDKLYDAIISGDTVYRDRLKNTYVDKDGNFDQSKYDTAVRTGLKENEPRIKAAAQARVDGNIAESQRIYHEIKKDVGGKFTPDQIMDAIYSMESDIRNDLAPEKVESQYDTGKFLDAVNMGETEAAMTMRDEIIDAHMANGKTQEQAEKAFESAVTSSIEDAFHVRELDEARAEEMLMEYAGKDEEEAASRVSYWSFQDEHPEYEQYKLTEANVRKYHEFAEPAGISMEVFVQFRDRTKDLANIKDEWGDVEKSVRDQTIEVIHSLPLTWQQKDALYLAAELAESRIWDVPW